MKFQYLHCFIFLIIVGLNISKSLDNLRIRDDNDQLFSEKLTRFIENFDLENRDEIVKYLEVISDHFRKITNGDMNNLSNGSIICKTCGRLFDFLRNLKYDFLVQILDFIGTEVCSLAKMYIYEVCQGAVREMVPHIKESLKYHYFDKDFMCPKLWMCPKVYEEINIMELRKEILKDKPSNVTDFYNEIKNGKKTLKILHISDLHTDLEYQEGSVANCNEPLCCRPESQLNKGETITKAGKWGTLADCDIPTKTLEKFVDFVKENIDIDYAIWTGDNTSHDIWHQSYNRNEKNSKNITEIFMKNFNFTVYPSIGNHESFPVNVYDFLSDREEEFDKFFSHEWENWIGKSAAATMLKYSFYSSYNEKYNLKVISLNSQACNSENFYLFKDPTDPGNMLSWLRSELYESERNKQFVYILSHYPNNECLEDYAQVFDAIIQRFNHIIRGIFTGHTHSDQFSVVRDSNNSQIINHVMTTPSLTTYTSRNPSFRVVEIDVSTMRPINYYQYRLNLTYWNSVEDENIKWDLVYNVIDEYTLPDFTVIGVSNLTEQLRTNEETIKKYAANKEARDLSINYKKYEKGIDINYYCDTFNIPSQIDDCKGNKEESWSDWIVKKLRGPWKKRLENN